MGGNFDHNRKIGYARRFRAGPEIIREIEDCILKNSSQYNNIPITVKTLEDPSSPILDVLFPQQTLPIIILREQKPERGKSAPLISFEETAQTTAFRENLASINSFIRDHWIDLLIPDADLEQLTRTQSTDQTEIDEDAPNEIDLIADRTLYRVFNNGSFEEGGRFYGGWWQRVPKHYRKFVTINWFPTAELDFSNMQIAMLYAREGMQLEGDAYSIEGVDRTYRPLIKRLMLQLINATGRIEAPRKSELPPGWSLNELQTALRAKHRFIADYFQTGIGIRLQRIDADIAEDVILTMKAEGVLALPVHDSFIVKEGHQDRLREAMIAAYQKRMEQPIQVDTDPRWLELLPAEAAILHEEGVYTYDDQLSAYEGQAGYERYKQRRTDFLKIAGEKWGHTHSFAS